VKVQAPWIKVLHIVPKETTRGGETFDHGVCFNSPASGSNPGGFGIKAGMYMDKSQVWNLSANRVIFTDNIKVGDEASVFSLMSPDGSSPSDEPVDESVPPKPPEVLPVE
jgi:hypothetical protein